MSALLEIARLRNENEDLREQVRQLKAVLAPEIEVPLEWGLSASERTIVQTLIARPVATRQMIWKSLYDGMKDDRDPKVIDVFMCKIRHKLRPAGIVISTVWGRGWALAPEWRERLARQA